MEKISPQAEEVSQQESVSNDIQKLTSSKLAKKLGMKTNELLEKLTESRHLWIKDGKHYLTDKGKAAGGEFRMSKKFGPYFIWPESISVE